MKKGYVHLYTGNGKGKTTAAFGMALRTLNSNKKVLVVQFLKDGSSGEVLLLNENKNFNYINVCMGIKFYWQLTDEEKTLLINEIKKTYEFCKKTLCTNEYDLIILDEILCTISIGALSENEIEELISCKNNKTELVLTGRYDGNCLYSYADYVTEMKCIKHPYNDGLKPRKGIEF